VCKGLQTNQFYAKRAGLGVVGNPSIYEGQFDRHGKEFNHPDNV